MATQTRNPTSDEAASGTLSGSAGTRYTLVDDYPDTTGADVLTFGTATAQITFGFSAFSIPQGATSISVQVLYYDGEAANGANNCGGRLKVGTQYFNAATHNPSGATYTSRSDNWATNPAGGAWTVDQVNGIGASALAAFGIGSTDSNPTFRVSSVQLQVTYTPAVERTGSGAGDASTQTASGSGAVVSSGSGTGATSAQTASASGAVTIAGSGSGTVNAQTGAGSGTVVSAPSDITGAGSGTAAAQTGSGAGSAAIAGAGSGAAGQQGASGAGTAAIGGTGTSTASSQTATGAGALVVSGTGAGTTSAQTGSGSATTSAIDGSTTGSGTGTATAQTGSGAGGVVVNGAGSGAAAAQTGAGSGTASQVEVPVPPRPRRREPMWAGPKRVSSNLARARWARVRRS